MTLRRPDHGRAVPPPLEETSAVTPQTMIDAIRHDDAGTTIQRTIGFEIETPEHV